jgi:multidrug efflux pump
MFPTTCAEIKSPCLSPYQVRGSVQGTARVFEESVANEPILIMAALAAVYIVLGFSTRAIFIPSILSTLPSVGVGAVLALLVFGTKFSIIAMIGVILLIGIVI